MRNNEFIKIVLISFTHQSIKIKWKLNIITGIRTYLCQIHVGKIFPKWA